MLVSAFHHVSESLQLSLLSSLMRKQWNEHDILMLYV